MAAGKLFGLKAKEPKWTISKEEDHLQVRSTIAVHSS